MRKHRPWAYILGFKELPYFGSEQFRQIYLVERICICIWIDVFVFVFVFETKLSKIFVFVFEKSKFLYLHLYLYLIKRIWPQPWAAAENIVSFRFGSNVKCRWTIPAVMPILNIEYETTVCAVCLATFLFLLFFCTNQIPRNTLRHGLPIKMKSTLAHD